MPIVLLTDFGLSDPYVGQVKGVIAGIAPGCAVIDLCHGVPFGDILAGALTLEFSPSYFPDGSVFCCVVDPGVGSSRRAIAASAGPWLFVGPDNGLLSLLWERHPPRRVVSLEERSFQLAAPSNTFHGRDIFAPVAAHLALGLPLERLGPEIRDPVRLSVPQVVRRDTTLHGQVLLLDSFGNAITNILAGDLDGAGEVHAAGLRFPIFKSYAQVAPGTRVALVGSTGRLELSVNLGSVRALGLVPGSPVHLEKP